MDKLPTRSGARFAVTAALPASQHANGVQSALMRLASASPDWQRFFQELNAVIRSNGPAPRFCYLSGRACPLRIKPADCELSPREIQCLRLAAQGKTSAETAHLLKVKVRTINFHFSNAFAKLQVKNKQAAVALAIQLRYI